MVNGQVAETFQMRVDRTPGLIVHIVEARRRLEGQPTSDLLSMPHNDLLEGSVVLEEFIKVRCVVQVVCNTHPLTHTQCRNYVPLCTQEGVGTFFHCQHHDSIVTIDL